MSSSPAETVRISHVAMAVADLEVSTRFYTEGLGFESSPSFESGDEVAAVSEVQPPVRMTARFLTKGGVRLELMGWDTPGVQGTASQYRNQRGLTHLSFQVDDIEETQERLLKLGGTAIPDASVHFERPPLAITVIFLADPDGSRVELVERREVSK